MTEAKDGTGQVRKLLARGAVKFKIAMASVLVLAVGAWLAPPAAQTALSTPQEHAAPLLEEQAQLREESLTFVGVQDVATPARQHSVAILLPALPAMPSQNDYSEPTTAQRPAAGFGVLVSETHALTHSAALGGRSTVELSLADGQTISGQVVTDDPGTGLVLLEVQEHGRTAMTRFATEAPPAGALAVAVGQSDGREVAVPVFVTSVGRDEYFLGTVNDAVLPGMPIFNLAGEFFAIAAPNGRQVRAIPALQAVDRMLKRVSTGERRSSFGLGYQTLSGGLAQTFGSDGVLITEVLPGGPGAAADIRVGDALLTVGDATIDSAETAARLLSTAAIGMPTPLRVRRGGRVRAVTATPGVAYEVVALARSSDAAAERPEARALFPGEVLELSGIPPTARVLSVNGLALSTRAQVQRVLRLARQPVPVLLRQESHQFFVSVEPTR